MPLPSEAAALRALFDLGVVRASWSHPGYTALRNRALASYQWKPGQPDPDYRLTPRGEALAKDLFR